MGIEVGCVSTTGGTTPFNRFTNQPGAAGTGSAVADLVLGFPYTGRATQFAASNGWLSLKYFGSGWIGVALYVRPQVTLWRPPIRDTIFGAANISPFSLWSSPRRFDTLLRSHAGNPGYIPRV